MAKTNVAKTKDVDVKVSFSEDVFLAIRSAGFSEKKIRDEMKKSLATYLFKKGVLSFGKAASLAGMCKSDFMDLLDEERVPLHYGVESFERDLETAEELSKECVNYKEGGIYVY